MYDRQIVAFIRSADCGSFTKAADALYTTAASVMNQVNSLESRVGTPLFHRNQKGLTLTAAGASLYQDAQTIVQLSEEAMDRARKLAGNAQTVFRVGTSLLNPCEAFLNVWNRVETRYPQYKLQVVPFSDTKAGITGVLDQLGKDIDFIIGLSVPASGAPHAASSHWGTTQSPVWCPEIIGWQQNLFWSCLIFTARI